MKKHIPNLFTALNLSAGLLGVLMAATDQLVFAAGFVFLGIFFDFFDGFFARKFQVGGELGKQLDSLADMVTSGVVPGIVMFQMILYASRQRWFAELSCETGNWSSYGESFFYFLPFIGLLIPVASAFRLAKFNIDERQVDSFIGLPTPAFSTFVMSLPLILVYAPESFAAGWVQEPVVLIAITLLGSYLLNAELPLFSLKFKHYRWKGNQAKYVFLIGTLVSLLLWRVVAIPLSIALYVGISIIDNQINIKKDSSQ